MTEGIDYGGVSSFKAPVMRIDDQGHGFRGVVFDASLRQASDYETNKLKWFVNKRLVLADSKPEGGSPCNDYIFHIACEGGLGAFTKRDEEGNAVKTSSGRNVLEVRQIQNEDIAVVFSSKWDINAARSVRLNTGHRVEFKRLTPARDENGDRMTTVECEITLLDEGRVVENPQRFNPVVESSGVDYGGNDEPPFPASPAPGDQQRAAAQQASPASAAQVPNGAPPQQAPVTTGAAPW